LKEKKIGDKKKEKKIERRDYRPKKKKRWKWRKEKIKELPTYQKKKRMSLRMMVPPLAIYPLQIPLNHVLVFFG